MQFRELTIGTMFVFDNGNPAFSAVCKKTSARGYEWTTSVGTVLRSYVGSINVNVKPAGIAPYKIVLYWNGNEVLSGTCSGVIAWENVRRLLIDNFTGSTRKYGELETPTLADVVNAPIGTRFSGTVSDETGTAGFELERIS